MIPSPTAKGSINRNKKPFFSIVSPSRNIEARATLSMLFESSTWGCVCVCVCVDIYREIFGLNFIAAIIPKCGNASGITSATPRELMASDNVTYSTLLLLVMPQTQHVREDEKHTKLAFSAKSAIKI